MNSGAGHVGRRIPNIDNILTGDGNIHGVCKPVARRQIRDVISCTRPVRITAIDLDGSIRPIWIIGRRGIRMGNMKGDAFAAEIEILGFDGLPG